MPAGGYAATLRCRAAPSQAYSPRGRGFLLIVPSISCLSWSYSAPVACATLVPRVVLAVRVARAGAFSGVGPSLLAVLLRLGVGFVVAVAVAPFALFALFALFVAAGASLVAPLAALAAPTT